MIWFFYIFYIAKSMSLVKLINHDQITPSNYFGDGINIKMERDCVNISKKIHVSSGALKKGWAEG